MADFNPELALSHTERAQLSQITVMPGWQVVNRICRSEVDKFIIALINANPARIEEVAAAHTMAKASAQFYAGFANHINEEVLIYTGAMRESDKPVDVTEGILDMEALRGLRNYTDLREGTEYE